MRGRSPVRTGLGYVCACLYAPGSHAIRTLRGSSSPLAAHDSGRSATSALVLPTGPVRPAPECPTSMDGWKLRPTYRADAGRPSPATHHSHRSRGKRLVGRYTSSDHLIVRPVWTLPNDVYRPAATATSPRALSGPIATVRHCVRAPTDDKATGTMSSCLPPVLPGPSSTHQLASLTVHSAR